VSGHYHDGNADAFPLRKPLRLLRGGAERRPS
jgi:hypothetical protein